MEINEASELAQRVVQEVGKHIIGKDRLLEKVMILLLANGHILWEDYPGLAKTLISNLFAQALGVKFKRIQFTSDLLPADITGTYVFNMKLREFEFRQGPLFANFILADEINRAPPKTQSAVLEAMQESQVTVEGNRFELESPFIVVATQNPVELEGTFNLPEAQLDRFIARLRVGYPDTNEEVSILENRIRQKKQDISVVSILDRQKFIEMQALVEEVYVDKEILTYIVNLVNASRKHDKLIVGASVRASKALLSIARASALYRGRDFVITEDVKDFAVNCLAHRVIVKTDDWLGGHSAERIITEILSKVTAPRKIQLSQEGEKDFHRLQEA